MFLLYKRRMNRQEQLGQTFSDPNSPISLTSLVFRHFFVEIGSSVDREPLEKSQALDDNSRNLRPKNVRL